MPEVDGVAVTKFIRKQESTIPGADPAYIISYTADVTPSAFSILIDCGSNEIMTKPTQIGFIENLVRRLVVEEQSTAE
jgi:CheY-like chemotaxis protein